MNKLKPQFETQSKPGAVLKLALLQFTATACFSLVLFYCFDAREAISALLGGLISVLASVFFAGRLFTTKQDAAAEEMLVRFYISVALKAVFTLAMMAICVVFLKVSMLPFIIAFILAAVVVNWLFFLIADA